MYALLGLLALQNCGNLMNVSGFRSLERIGTLVIDNAGGVLSDYDGFNSLYEANFLIITNNPVR